MSTNKRTRDCEDEKEEEEPRTYTERVAELKRVHAEAISRLARENADLRERVNRFEHAERVAKAYPKHERLIEWLGGPEEAFPGPIAKAAMRLMRAKQHDKEAERFVKHTLQLVSGVKRPGKDPGDSVNGWMDALQKSEDLEKTIDIFLSMMRILEA